MRAHSTISQITQSFMINKKAIFFLARPFLDLAISMSSRLTFFSLAVMRYDMLSYFQSFTLILLFHFQALRGKRGLQRLKVRKKAANFINKLKMRKRDHTGHVIMLSIPPLTVHGNCLPHSVKIAQISSRWKFSECCGSGCTRRENSAHWEIGESYNDVGCSQWKPYQKRRLVWKDTWIAYVYAQLHTFTNVFVIS